MYQFCKCLILLLLFHHLVVHICQCHIVIVRWHILYASICKCVSFFITLSSCCASGSCVQIANSWAEFKKKEAEKKKANLGRVGPKGFQSRSMQSFQEAMERGEATHLMPMFNAKEKLKSGKIKKEDIPYMQRGGAWDDSDVSGAKKKNWLKSDKKYASGGFLKSQSVSILGEGKGLDWTGKQSRSGPTQGVKLGKNYKAPTVSQLKGGATEEPKRKKNIFGF